MRDSVGSRQVDQRAGLRAEERERRALPGGVLVRTFDVNSREGVMTLHVAEPPLRRHAAPVLAAHPDLPRLAAAGRRAFSLEGRLAGVAEVDPARSLQQLLREYFGEQHPAHLAGPGGPISSGAHTDSTPASPTPSTVQSQATASAQAYFESAEAWKDAPEPYQLQLYYLLHTLLGERRQKVLDVGCGNGLITNLIQANHDVTALDYSATALESVRAPKLRGSITALPFADAAFDVVYCFDVIEHLPWADALQGLKELQRVARRHVLLAVPYAEDLPSNSRTCAKCGSEFHVNGHLRAHDRVWLGRVPVTAAFERTALWLSGDLTVPPANPFARAFRAAGLGPVGVSAACPRCGADPAASAPAAEPASAIVQRMLGSMLSEYRARSVSMDRESSDRSEGLVLLSRKGEPVALLPATAPVQDAACGGRIEFANLLQGVTEDFVSGSRWPRYRLGGGTRVDAAGLRLLDPQAAQSSPVMLRFPLLVEQGPRLTLEVSCDHAEGSISLFGIDGITGRIVPLAEHAPVAPGDSVLEIELGQKNWEPDRFGLALDLYLYGGACVRSVAWVPNDPTQGRRVAEVRPGMNVVSLGRENGVPVYWTLFSLASGRVPVGSDEQVPVRPLPRPFFLQWYLTRLDGWRHQAGLPSADPREVAAQERLQALLAIGQSTRQFRSWILQARARRFLKHRLARLLPMRLRPRRLRAAFDRLFVADGWLNLDAVLAHPPRWQKGDVALAVPADSPRVLVVSHMFPHPDQPGLGSFVLEQVQALRRLGVDARVVSGRPFWLTAHRSPLRLLGGLINYGRLYRASASRWWTVDDVPVRFLPYPILGRFFTHGWTYRWALAANGPRLRTEFPPDLVHAHTGYLDGSVGKALARAFDVPWVVTEHTGPFSMLMQHPVVRRSTLGNLSAADRVITVSHAQRKSVEEWLMQPKGAHPILVVPNVVDVGRFRLVEQWTPRPEAPRLLFVGYFVPIKNIPLLLSAFEIVVRHKPAATLTLVGGGEVPGQVDALLASVAARGLTQSVTVKLFCPREEVARLMREECDMLVLQSKSETFACVVAEALASGKPAVITRCGGPEDIVTEDWMGSVCDNEDPQALAAGILDVSDRLPSFDPARIGRSARERFSAASVSASLLGLYRELMKQGATGRGRRSVPGAKR